jgi:tetratricopeptide (TPR) repeat protein
VNDPNTEETIFAAARQLPSEDRAAYLDQACGDNEPLRRRIEALLNASEQSGAFLEVSAAPTLRRTPAASIPLAEKPGDKVGRYKLLQQIGEGGCGVVYMAEQEEPVRRRVALKIIKLGMDTRQVIARFEAERQALAMMDHPNIAKVFDAGATETGRPYFVMELVRGVKITDYCDEQKLSTRERLDLFMQVCHAIQHAHQKGIIHRDIKPSNILVTMQDCVPVPKVIDFGIVKATGGQALTDKTVFTAFEQFIGTPAYMSPEQAMMTSQDIDTRSDIYALGVLLYELLTGKTPFDAKELLAIGLDELRRTICEKEPDRPSTRLSTLSGDDLDTTAQRRSLGVTKLVSQLRGDLDCVVMKALEKDRSRRYETANGLAMDIQRYLNNEPIVARPPNRLYRFQKMVRRNKLTFAAASAVVILLIAGLSFSTWMFLQEKAAKQEQVRLRKSAEASETRARIQSADNRALLWRSQMGFYLSSSNYADVDSILKNLLTPEQAKLAVNAPILNVRADYLGLRGRWNEAAADLWKLVELDPDDLDSCEKLGSILSYENDLPGYRRLCQMMLTRFGSTTNAEIADRIIKTCCILKPAENDLPTIARLVECLTDDYARDMVDNLPWLQFAKALAAYRLGNYSNAVEILNKNLAARLRFSDNMRYLEGYMVLAMAHSRLDQMDEAHDAFARGAEIANSMLSNPASSHISGVGRVWQNLLFGHVLMREAKVLIEGGPEKTLKRNERRDAHSKCCRQWRCRRGERVVASGL